MSTALSPARHGGLLLTDLGQLLLHTHHLIITSHSLTDHLVQLVTLEAVLVLEGEAGKPPGPRPRPAPVVYGVIHLVSQRADLQ